MSIERKQRFELPKQMPPTETPPVDIVLFEKNSSNHIIEFFLAEGTEVSPKVRKEILNKMSKMKDLDDHHPSDLSVQFQVPVQTIYEELETLRSKKERKTSTKNERRALWDQFIALREQGVTDPEIGRRYGIPEGTIASEWTHMRKEGIVLPPRKTGRPPKQRHAGPLPIMSSADRLHILKQDLSRRDAGEILGILPESVHRYRRLFRNQGVDIPKRQPGAIPSLELRQKKKDAARMRDEGFEISQIATELSIKPHQVSNYIYQGRKLP